MALYSSLMSLRASARSLQPMAFVQWDARGALVVFPMPSRSVMKRRVSMSLISCALVRRALGLRGRDLAARHLGDRKVGVHGRAVQHQAKMRQPSASTWSRLPRRHCDGGVHPLIRTVGWSHLVTLAGRPDPHLRGANGRRFGRSDT